MENSGNRATVVATAAVAALAYAGAARSHHTGAMYQTTPVWVQGTVVRFEPIDPHTITTLEATGEDGRRRQWRVEGPPQNRIARSNLGASVPEVGDVIEFCAFPYKSTEELSRLFPEADFSNPRRLDDSADGPIEYVVGHVMVLPNGALRAWEPHGIVGACIASSDRPRQAWLDFLDTAEDARGAFCEQRRYAVVQSDESLAALIEEINARLDNPCG